MWKVGLSLVIAMDGRVIPLLRAQITRSFSYPSN